MMRRGDRRGINTWATHTPCSAPKNQRLVRRYVRQLVYGCLGSAASKRRQPSADARITPLLHNHAGLAAHPATSMVGAMILAPSRVVTSRRLTLRASLSPSTAQACSVTTRRQGKQSWHTRIDRYKATTGLLDWGGERAMTGLMHRRCVTAG